jgi:arylsulfatase A-like enzyme/tetratricopeptide (TPR) repeat protein
MRRTLVLLLAGFAVGCAGRAPEAQNVLLVSLDTTRADRLGSYGWSAARTPVLDAIAARGLRFTQARTVTPLTLPAHASLLTGTFPAWHGVRDNGGFYLGEEQVTWAETLQQKGFRTGAFVASFVLDGRWGTAQGFDRYFDDFDLSRHEGQGMDAVQRRGDAVVDQALRWLAEDRAKPFFAWVHLYDPHTPYEAPEPWRSQFPATASGAYDAEIAFMDAQVGRLIEALRADGRLDRTVVVAVGDHGESLGEHEEQAHGFFVYDATVHVPLLVAGPGITAAVVDDPVRIVDVMPTALGALGVAAPAVVQGASLLQPAGRQGLVSLSESFFPRYHYGWSELTAVTDGRFKLVRAPRPELYDLHADPGETRDLAGVNTSRVAAMQRATDALLARVSGKAAAQGPQAVDPETEERLRALGYVGSSATARVLEDRPRADPKDRISLYNQLKLAGTDSAEGRLDAAVARVREALATDPEIVEGWTLLGNFLVKQERYEDAAEQYRRALALDPEHQGATFSLALTYKHRGLLKEAETGFERARSLDPRGGRAVFQLADLAMRRQDHARAEALLREALGRRVDRPAFQVKLGECLLEMQRAPEAEKVLREALAARPDVPGGQYNLALAREAQGDPAGAAEAYAAELRRDGKAHRAAFNLGKLLLRAGRARESAERFRASVDAAPTFGTGWLYLAKALFEVGDLPGAEAAARRGLASAPEPGTAPLGHLVLADLYTAQGRPKEAQKELQAAKKARTRG